MYQVGDLIYYGNTGVCKVTDISPSSLPGATAGQLYYTIKPLYQECVIYAPVDSEKVFIRPVISREEAERLIDQIPSIRAEAYHGRVISELAQHYESALRTHDCGNLIEMTMSIYAKKRTAEAQKRKFGMVDERFMKRAEELLFGELAAALDMDREKVPAYIATRVDALQQEEDKGEARSAG